MADGAADEQEMPGRNSGRRHTALVTGGTDGIGKAIAHMLAKEGIEVVVVGSNPKKGGTAVHDLREISGNDHIEFLQVDLSIIANANALAASFSARWPRLHYLVLCAGIMRGEYTLTADGYETNFAINYLSRFALTEALLPRLAEDGLVNDASRILVISSAALSGTIHYDDVNLAGKFSIFRVVSQFCEANDVFTVELARQLKEAAPPPFVIRNSLLATYPSRRLPKTLLIETMVPYRIGHHQVANSNREWIVALTSAPSAGADHDPLSRVTLGSNYGAT